MKKFITTEYTIESVRVPEEFHGKKLVFLSDYHNNEYGVNEKALLKTLKDLAPSFILLSGDMFTGSSHCDNRNAAKFLSFLPRIAPTFCSLGNHEARLLWDAPKYPEMWEFFKDTIQENHITLLDNSSLFLGAEGGLRISGLSIGKEYYKKMVNPRMVPGYVGKCLGAPIGERDPFTILLAHNPVYFPNYAEWGADLVLSGHVHGGIMRLPYVGGVMATNMRPFPKYDYGMYIQGKSTMILTSGIGTHTIPFRPLNPAEVVVIQLLRKV
ncbi:MAG: metallophosphoesterase [Lachnospiraceae bacterium]|nr:metallophosphoesterase [Lachnospiraceae bacterium]